MNKIFKVIWDKISNNWIVVSELSSSISSRSYSISVIKNNVLNKISQKNKINLIVIGILSFIISINNVAYAESADCQKNSSSGAGDFLCGDSTTTNGAYKSTAIGNNAVIYNKAIAGKTGVEQALAIGSNVQAKGDNSLVLGNDAVADGSGAVSVGGDDAAGLYNAKERGYHLKSFGTKKTDSNLSTYRANAAIGNGATSIGANAQALAAGSISIGPAATAGEGTQTENDWKSTNGKQSVAIGAESYAGKDNSVALGYQAEATAINATAIGKNGRASAQNSIALGTNAYADADDTIIIGRDAKNTSGTLSGTGLPADNGINAIGIGSSTKSAANSIAIGRGAEAKISEARAIAIGDGAVSAGGIALGQDAVVLKGNNPSETASASVSIGRQAAVADYGVALGSRASVGTTLTADGKPDKITNGGLFGTAVGINSHTYSDSAASLGHNATVLEDATSALALGHNAMVAKNAASGVAIGDGAFTSGKNSVAIGKGAKAQSENTISIGTGNTVSGKNSGAIGDPNTVSGTGSYALGNNNTITAGNAFVIGSNVTNNITGSVVLGNDSAVAAATPTASAIIAGKIYSFAGATPGSVVSVGATGKERQIQNVAAGRISTTSTDAINGSQLYATGQAVETLGERAVQYDLNADGTTNKGSVTLNPGAAAAQIHNVANGTAPDDAVNLSQLNTAATGVKTHYISIADSGTQRGNYNNDGATKRFAMAIGTNARAELESAVALGNGAKVSDKPAYQGGVAIGSGALTQQDNTSGGNFVTNVAVGNLAKALSDGTIAIGELAEATGTYAIGLGSSSLASGKESLAFGFSAKAGNAGDVALGAGSVTAAAAPTALTTVAGKTYNFAGAAPASVVSVGAAGKERQIQNVAAGRVSATSTDAINGSQLFSTNEALGRLADSTTNILGGNAATDPNTGNINTSNIGGTGKNTVHDAIKAAYDQASNPLSFAGDSGAGVKRKLGETVNVVGGERDADKLTDDNIGVITDGTDKLTVKLAKELKGLTSITTGDTTLNNNGLTIVGGPGMTKDGGINAAGKPVSNVASGGDTLTNAANIGDVKNAVKDISGTGKGGFGLKDDAGTELKESLGKTIQVKGDGNIKTEIVDNADGSKALELTMAKDLDVGGPNKGGTAGEDGTIRARDKDGKAGVSLNGKDGTIGLTGPAGTGGKNPSATIGVRNGAPGVNGKDGENIPRLVYTKPDGSDETVATLNDGLKFRGDTGDVIAKSLNETLVIKGNAAADAAVTDKNLRVDNVGGILVARMTRALSDLTSAGFTDVAGNRTVVDGSGITITPAGTPADKAVSLTRDGLSNGGRQISNVASGGDTLTNAANIGDVKNAVNHVTTDIVNKGFGIQAGDGNAVKKSLGENIEIIGDGKNITTVVKDNKVSVRLAENIDLGKNGSIKTGDTEVSNQGLTIAGGPSVTKQGIDAAGKVISNVAAGVRGTDAVNVNQLTDSLKDAAKSATWTLGTQADNSGHKVSNQTVTVNHGVNTKVSSVHVDDKGNYSYEIDVTGLPMEYVDDKGNTLVNVGGGFYTQEKDPASGKLTLTPATPAKVRISSEKPMQLTNVAAGSITADSTDAVNGSQLKSVGDIIGGDNVTYEHGKPTLKKEAFSELTTAGGGKTTVTGSKYESPTNVVTAVNTLNKEGTKYFKANSAGVAAKAEGKDSIAVGANSQAKVENSVAMGNGATVKTSAAKGSVALGSDSAAGPAHVGQYSLNGKPVAGRVGTDMPVVSLGSENAERQLQFVAPGVLSASSTDAVNGSQLYATNQQVLQNTQNIASLGNKMNDLDYKINGLNKDIRGIGASAAAMSGIPQAYMPGKSLMGLGVGGYGGESAIAIGVSRISDNGKVILKLNTGQNTRGNYSVGAGIGYQW